MSKKKYISPHSCIVSTQLGGTLLTTSSGMPALDSDGLSYDGPSGSFGEDESVASKSRNDWDYEW